MKTKLLFLSLIVGSVILIAGCKKNDDSDSSSPTPTPTPAPSPTQTPTLTVGVLSSITDSSAMCGGNVTAEGASAITAVGVCWDTLPDPTLLKSHTIDGAGIGNYTSHLTGLADNTTYYVKAYATNFYGTTYSSQLSFTTLKRWKVFGLTTQSVNSLALNGTTLFAGTYGNGVYSSTDSGNSWNHLINGLNTNVLELAMSISGTTIFAGTDAGVFRSSNNGTTWGTPGLVNYSIGSLVVSGITIYAGTTVNGLFKSINNGSTWTYLGLPSSNIGALAINGTTILVSTGFGISRSTDNGVSWTSVSSTVFPGSFAVIGTTFFAGSSNGVFKSTDNGNSWVAVNGGLPTNPEITALCISGTSIYAGIYQHGVYQSDDDGGSWTPIHAGMTSSYVWSLITSGTTIFAGTSNGIFSRPL
jgi:hypothetical protein